MPKFWFHNYELLFFFSLRLCVNHHIAIWRRNVSEFDNLGSPWRTLCRESEISLDVEGGWALVEFRSGGIIPPYLYNGFRATVHFIHNGRRKFAPSSSFPNSGGNVPASNQITVMYPTRPTVLKTTNSHDRIEVPGVGKARDSGKLSNENIRHSDPQILAYTAPPPMFPQPQQPSLFNLASYDDNEDDNIEEPLGYPRASFGKYCVQE